MILSELRYWKDLTWCSMGQQESSYRKFDDKTRRRRKEVNGENIIKDTGEEKEKKVKETEERKEKVGGHFYLPSIRCDSWTVQDDINLHLDLVILSMQSIHYC